MRVCLIITNLQGGGAEKAVLRVADILKTAGVGVWIILLENNITYNLPDDITPHILIDKKRANKGFFAKRVMAWRLANLIEELSKEEPFDLVVSNLPFANEICKLARIKNHFNCIHDSLSVEVGKLAQKSALKAKRKLAKYKKLYDGQNLIAVSHGVANDLTNRLGIAPKRLEVIPNPFNFEEIKALSKEPMSEPVSLPFVLHVGRFSAQKRQDLALDAWKIVTQKITSHKLLFLTDNKAALEMMVKEQNLSEFVEVVNFVQNPYAYMYMADLMILCSDHEGLPTVLIESLICATPAVSTDCPSGPAEILKDFPQNLIACNDANALADVITTKISKPKIAPSANLSEYSSDEVLKKWLQIIKDLNV